MMNNLFMGFLFIIGIVLIACYTDIDKHTNASCKSDALRKANIGILVIGLLFMCLSVGKFVCTAKCDCGESGDASGKVYAGFVLVLSIVLLSLSSTILANAKKCGVSASKSPNTLLGISITLLLLSAGYIAFSIYLTYQTGGMMFSNAKLSNA